MCLVPPVGLTVLDRTVRRQHGGVDQSSHTDPRRRTGAVPRRPEGSAWRYIEVRKDMGAQVSLLDPGGH